MKPRDHRLVGQVQCPITNQEIIRARAVTAELKLKLNIEKAQKLRHTAHELMHTARNLMSIHRLTLEEIHWRRYRNLTNH